MASGREGAHTIPPCGCPEPGVAVPFACYCSVEDLLRILRRRYSLAVLNAIRAHEPARYHTLSAALPRMSSSTLVETLGALAVCHLINREEPTEAHAQPLYRLTPAGDKLLSRLKPLLDDVRDS